MTRLVVIQSGFKDPSNFNRAFRKRFGISVGQRVKKVSGGQSRYYFYDVTGNPVWEYYGGYWDTLNLTLNGRLIFTRTVPGAFYNYNAWMYLDHLGSPRVKVRDTGAEILGSRAAYYPYGEQIMGTGDGIRYKFTGKERDTESGADYFGARYYASTIGRFGTTDPFLGSGRPENPQSWNRYVYALGNPLKYYDPTGMDPVTPVSVIQDEERKKRGAAAAQGAATGTGAMLLNDGIRRGQYQLAASHLSGPSASAARKTLQAETYKALSPIGKGLTDVARSARANQLVGKTAEQLAASASHTNPAWNAIGSGSKVAGAVGVTIGVRLSCHQIATAPEGQRGIVTAGEVGGLAGALAGGYGGAKLGAAIGTLIEPGGGTVVGAIIGGLVGGGGGAIVGEKAGAEIYRRVEE